MPGVFHAERTVAAAALRRQAGRKSRWLVAILLGIHAALLAYSAAQHSPTHNEIGHLPAGIAHWRYGLFHLYRVNPPLPRMVAALPVLAMDPKTDWSGYGVDPLARDEVPIGSRFVRANGGDSFRLFAAARWACIPFSLIGALVCWRWAFELWGRAGGWLALLLWCFDPLILGHGALVMPDVPAAAMGVAAAYLFWRWLLVPSWGRAAVTGLVLGAAALCKTTLLVFFLIGPVLWCLQRWRRRTLSPRGPWAREVGMLASMAALAVYVINLGYAFAGSGTRLSDFPFESRLLSGQPSGPARIGNRFAGTFLGAVPVPLPADYLKGIDRQRADFEQTEHSYLGGRWRMGGWWYYHPYALAVKVPLGTWALLLAAVGAGLACRARAADLGDELCLLVPPAVILVLLICQTGIGNHLRYALPAIPFFFVGIGRLGRAVRGQSKGLALLVGAALGWSVAASLWVYPHSLSYFNELAGGPRGGHRHLLDSNIAWGQDLLYLRRWLDRHPEARPIRLASYGWVDPRWAGIEFSLPPVGPRDPARLPERADPSRLGPQPGWFAVDVNFLHATHWPAADGRGGSTDVGPGILGYEYFLRFRPVAMAGYSIYLYHLDLDQANRARRQIGLPEL